MFESISPNIFFCYEKKPCIFDEMMSDFGKEEVYFGNNNYRVGYNNKALKIVTIYDSKILRNPVNSSPAEQIDFFLLHSNSFYFFSLWKKTFYFLDMKKGLDFTKG